MCLAERSEHSLFVKQISVRDPEQFQGRKREKGSEEERQKNTMKSIFYVKNHRVANKKLSFPQKLHVEGLTLF